MRKFSLLCWVVAMLAPPVEANLFEFPADTFSFSNELYFEYQVRPDNKLTIHRRTDGHGSDVYSRHCFVLVRAILQFHKFAEFRQDLPPLSEEEYAQRIRRLSRIPAWSSGPKEKIQFPGYRDLYSFSAAHPLVLQNNLGLWWPTYLRLGNWRIVLPVPRSGQKRLAQSLKERLDRGTVQAVFITRFRPINHCLVVYRYRVEPTGDLVFLACDVNQPGRLVHLRYQASDESFYFDRTWYYPGGRVNVLPLYVSLLM